MAKGDRKFAPLFSVWAIDAWAEGEDGWTWNDKHKLFEFRTTSLNLKRAFVSRLRKFLANGVPTVSGLLHYSNLGRGWYYIVDDWDFIELRKRANDEPVYAAIRETPG